MKFSEMPYVRPDLEALRQAADSPPHELRSRYPNLRRNRQMRKLLKVSRNRRKRNFPKAKQ